DHIYVLENGRIARSGSAAELEKDAAIQKAYLGLAAERRPSRAQTLVRPERRSLGGFVNPFARSVDARKANGLEEEQTMANQLDSSVGSGFFHPFARTVAPRAARPSQPVAAPQGLRPAQLAPVATERLPIPTTGGFVNPQARSPKQ